MSENKKDNPIKTWTEDITGKGLNYEKMSEGERVTAVKDIMTSFAEKLVETEDGNLMMPGIFIKNYELIGNKSPWLRTVIGSDNLTNFEELLNGVNFPAVANARHEIFYQNYEGVFGPQEEQASMIDVYFPALPNPLLAKAMQGKHTQFSLLTGILVNTNTLLNLEQSVNVVRQLSVYSSLFYDFYLVHEDIKNGLVQYNSLNPVYDCIIERALARASIAMKYFDGEDIPATILPDLKALYNFNGENLN
jgi:hypothetical protein